MTNILNVHVPDIFCRSILKMAEPSGVSRDQIYEYIDNIVFADDCSSSDDNDEWVYGNLSMNNMETENTYGCNKKVRICGHIAQNIYQNIVLLQATLSDQKSSKIIIFIFCSSICPCTRIAKVLLCYCGNVASVPKTLY